jgi:hypothetical protein
MVKEKGSVLALSLFLALAVLIVTRLFSDLMSAAIAAQKAQTAADFALVSALRVRAQSLEAIAARWDMFGSVITVVSGALQAPAGTVSAIGVAAETLRRAISGYQGRITAALTVAAEANGADRAKLTQVVSQGLKLNLDAQRAPLSAPDSPTVEIDGLWYRRTWTGPAVVAAVELNWHAAYLGGVWELSRISRYSVAWDADITDPLVSMTGNGGFAPDWASASPGPYFRPHRFPVFRVDSDGPAS